MHEQDGPANGDDRGAGTPEIVARSYFASFETGDPDAIAAHVRNDFVNEHTASLGSGCVGRANYRERLPGFLADMVGLRYDIEHLVVAGHEVMACYRMRARWQGETPIDIRGAQYLEIRDGLVVHRIDYWDSAAFLLQVDEDATAALAEFGIGPD